MPLREISLHVTNTTYSGLQEHRIVVYTATFQRVINAISDQHLSDWAIDYIDGLHSHSMIVSKLT
jgi:hypothetical protein